MRQYLNTPLASVMHKAQAGQLPLFAWTLGLPAEEFRQMAHHWFPDWNDFSDLPDNWFETQLAHTPKTFFQLVGLLVSYRATDHTPQEAQWVARAIAAACFGCQNLWQDLGMTGRADLAKLMHAYFPRLAARNPAGTPWKPFLFRELGNIIGQPGIRPPGCGRCREAVKCFG